MRLPVTATLLTLSFTTLAAPPKNVDPALGPFFKSLKQPGTEISCCDFTDCRPVQTRIVNGNEEIFVDKRQFKDGNDTWVVVPDDKRLSPRDNPTGENIACWSRFYGVMCFLRGVGG